MSSPPRIAIIGGGPGGLTTGLLLHKRGIPFTIFELREAPTEAELSTPSGMLDLHDESGIAAIKECDLYSEFLGLIGECSEAQRVADKTGTILYADEGEQSNRPEISRHALTRLLLSHLPAEHIKWNHKLLSARLNPSSSSPSVSLDFGPNGTHTFDLVIGADGAWSKVRALLTDTKPQYSGTQCITLTARHVSTKHPSLAALVGAGSFSALGTRHGVMSQRGPQDSARIYVFLSTPDEAFAATSGLAGHPASHPATKERLLTDPQLLGEWGPAVKRLVATACDEEAADHPGKEVDVRGIYVLPVGHSWAHTPGATIIGDAAHLMGPWAGEGVNLAMWDSLLLAKAVGEAFEGAGGKGGQGFHEKLEPLMRAFEEDLVSRAKEKAEESVANGEMLFCEDGAKAFVDFFHSFRPPVEEGGQ